VDQWLSALLGGGVVTGGAVTLILTGKLLPSWVVKRQMDDSDRRHDSAVKLAKEAADRSLTLAQETAAAGLAGVQAAHTRAEQDAEASHVRELASKDREQDRLVAERDYEREARNVERNRADANAQALAEGTREFGETIVHLLRSLPDVPESSAPRG
jgi:hypothetical protein